MSLIEGIGDEVLHFCILLLVFVMGAIAWWSTNIAESPLLTTVLILERRTRTRHANQRNESVTSRQITATAVTVTDANSVTGTRNGIDTGQNGVGRGEVEERVGETQEVVSGGGVVVEREDDDKQEESNGQRTLVVETDVEPAPGDIFEIVEEGNTDSEPAAENSSLLRRRRLAFFMNRGPTLIEPVTPTEPVTPSEAAPSVEQVGAGQQAERTTSHMEPETDESLADCIRIRLKYLNDDQTVVEGRLQEQLGDFKRRHFRLELAAEKMVRLIFNGQVLQSDSQTLQGYGLFDNCVVHCLVHNQRTNQSSRSPSAGSNSSNQQTNNNSSGRNNGTAPPEWNLGTVLYASLSICLGFALYCRYQYSHLFTVTTSAALFGLSAIFAVTLVGQFLPDSETVQ